MDEATGNVVRPDPATAAPQQPRRLQLGFLPVSLTCGLYSGRTLVDLTAEEEALVDAVVTTTVDASGDVLGAQWQEVRAGQEFKKCGCGALRPRLAVGTALGCSACPAFQRGGWLRDARLRAERPVLI